MTKVHSTRYQITIVACPAYSYSQIMMKAQITASSISEMEHGILDAPPAEEKWVQPDPEPESPQVRKGREIKPLALVLSILALALLFLIPSLLLLQRLQS